MKSGSSSENCTVMYSKEVVRNTTHVFGVATGDKPCCKPAKGSSPLLPLLYFLVGMFVLLVSCAAPQKEVEKPQLFNSGKLILQLCEVPVVYFIDSSLGKDATAIQKGFEVWNVIASRTLFEYGGELNFAGDYPPLPFMAVEANDLTTACGHTSMLFLDTPASNRCIIKAKMVLGADCRLTPTLITAVITHEAGHLFGFTDVYDQDYTGVMYFKIRPPLNKSPSIVEQKYVQFRYGKTEARAP